MILNPKGSISKFGYNNLKVRSKKDRRKAISKAIKSGKKPMPLFRRLILKGTFNKYKDPMLSSIFMEDAYWLRQKKINKKFI
jgi:hypothetical protein